jgi:hypothetical protein
MRANIRVAIDNLSHCCQRCIDKSPCANDWMRNVSESPRLRCQLSVERLTAEAKSGVTPICLSMMLTAE